jgi:hypothetical protein
MTALRSGDGPLLWTIGTTLNAHQNDAAAG